MSTPDTGTVEVNVTYEDKTSARQARVEFRFLAASAGAARDIVASLLSGPAILASEKDYLREAFTAVGHEPSPPQPAAADAGVNDPNDVDARIVAITERQKAKRGRPPKNKETPGAEGRDTPSQPATGDAAGEGAGDEALPATNDPAALPQETSAGEAAPVASEPGQGVAPGLTAEAAPAITDAELHHEIAAKNAIIQNPAAIKAVIAEYKPDDAVVFYANDISPAQRAEFIEKIKALS